MPSSCCLTHNKGHKSVRLKLLFLDFFCKEEFCHQADFNATLGVREN